MTVQDVQTETPERWILVIFQKLDAEFVVERSLVREVRNQCHTRHLCKESAPIVDLWLNTPGGDADAAYKLMLLLRGHCQRLRVAVPDYAKSAGTLLAIGADEVFMDTCTELGPLDAQIEHPDREGERISALDMANSLEYLAERAIWMIMVGGASIVKVTGLRRAEVLGGMVQLAAQFMRPLVEKLDPSIIHKAKQELDVAREYGERLLEMRCGQGDAGEPEDDLLATAPAKLVTDYPSHSFVIGPAEARKLGMSVSSADDYDLWGFLNQLYDLFQSSPHKSLVRLVKEDEIATIIARLEGVERDDREGIAETPEA